MEKHKKEALIDKMKKAEFFMVNSADYKMFFVYREKKLYMKHRNRMYRVINGLQALEAFADNRWYLQLVIETTPKMQARYDLFNIQAVISY